MFAAIILIAVLVMLVGLICFMSAQKRGTAVQLGRAPLSGESLVVKLAMDENEIPLAEVIVEGSPVMCVPDTGSDEVLVTSCQCKGCDNAVKNGCVVLSNDNAGSSGSIRYGSQDDTVERRAGEVTINGKSLNGSEFLSISGEVNLAATTERKGGSSNMDTSHYSILGVGPRPGRSSLARLGGKAAAFYFSKSKPNMVVYLSDDKSAEEFLLTVKDPVEAAYKEISKCSISTQGIDCDGNVAAARKCLIDTGSNYVFAGSDIYPAVKEAKKLSLMLPNGAKIRLAEGVPVHESLNSPGALTCGVMALKGMGVYFDENKVIFGKI